MVFFAKISTQCSKYNLPSKGQETFAVRSRREHICVYPGRSKGRKNDCAVNTALVHIYFETRSTGQCRVSYGGVAGQIFLPICIDIYIYVCVVERPPPMECGSV